MSIAMAEPTYMRLMESLARLFEESTPDKLARAVGVFRAEAALALEIGEDDAADTFEAVADAIAAECIARQDRRSLS